MTNHSEQVENACLNLQRVLDLMESITIGDLIA
jgi:hypothetical protein